MKEQHAVQAGHPYKRRDHDGIDERLAEEQPVGPPIELTIELWRPPGAQPQMQLAPTFQEDPVEVPPLVGEIPVVGHAERHRDIGRLVPLDATAGLHQIKRQGRPAPQNQDQDRRKATRI